MNKKSITKYCAAKINLAIDVIGRRDNGYHNVRMVMAQVGVCDTVCVSLRSDGRIVLSGRDMPLDKSNLAYRAAEAFFDAAETMPGCDISIEKRIPMGAGMAGGSADAAGVIDALNELISADMPLEQRMKIGGRLGADIPFCIMGGCVLAEGIGDELTPLGTLPDMYYLIAKPQQSISTKWVYENLDFSKKPDGMDIDSLVSAIKYGDRRGIYASMGNVLENAAVTICPEIDIYKADMLKLGAEASLMSGSGSAVFGIFEDERLAGMAKERFLNIHPSADTWICGSNYINNAVI